MAFGLFWQAGALTLLAVRFRTLSWMEWLCLGFGLGVGLITLEMLVASLAGLAFDAVSLCVPWAILWALWAARRPWSMPQSFRWPSIRTAAGFDFRSALGTLTFALIATVLFRATFFPIFEWDGWAIWDLKARAFYHQQSIFPFVNDAYYHLTHLDYPLLFPLAGTFVYLIIGGPASLALLLPAAFYTALLGVFYAGLRRHHASRAGASILTLGLACTPNVLFWSTQFYAELPLVYYLLAGALSFSLYLREQEWSWLILSAALFGFATQTKVEAIFLILPALMILILRSVPKSRLGPRQAQWAVLGLYAGVVGVVYSPWFLFRRFVAPFSESLSGAAAARAVHNLPRLPDVVVTFLEWLGRPDSQTLFFLIFPATLALVALNWRRFREWSFAYLVLQTAMTLVPYLVFLVAEPHWLELPRLGRYLMAFTVMCWGLFAVQAVEAFRPLAFAGVPAQVQRGLIGLTLGIIAIFELGADIWPGHPTTPLFTSRPISLVRQVYAEASGLLALTPAEREQALNLQVGRGVYGRLMQVIQANTPPTEAVLILTRPDDDSLSNFLLQRSYYLLYPRRVMVVSTAPTGDSLLGKGVGTLLVYDRDLNAGELPGAAFYQEEFRYAAVRVNTAPDSIRRAPGFTDAPAQFAEGIQLIGYQLLPGALGEPTLLILDWQAEQATSKSLTVFVHVFSGDDFITQHDSPPMQGWLPTEGWRPGALVLDLHPLALTRAQLSGLRFCIGLYDSASLERVPLLAAPGYEVQDNSACRSFPPP